MFYFRLHPLDKGRLPLGGWQLQTGNLSLWHHSGLHLFLRPHRPLDRLEGALLLGVIGRPYEGLVQRAVGAEELLLGLLDQSQPLCCWGLRSLSIFVIETI